MTTLVLHKETEKHHLVTLNRPEKRNALNTHMRKELINILQSINDELPIFFEGIGPCFCAGLDLKEHINEEVITEYKKLIGIIQKIKNKTSAIIEGSVRGGGLIIALSCDRTYAVQEASFGMPNFDFIENQYIKAALQFYVNQDERLIKLVEAENAVTAAIALERSLINKILKPNFKIDELL